MSKNRGQRDQAAKAPDPPAAAASPDMNVLMEAIANSEKTILERIDSSTKDLNDKIDTIKEDIVKQDTRLQDVESGLNVYSDRTEQLEDGVSVLRAEVARLANKLDDLEGRQRRCNARIVGVKEGFENTGKPTDVIATMLKDVLGLGFTPMLDRAHRGLQRPAQNGDPPRVIVVKFHYFQEKAEVFKTAANSSPLKLQGRRISIFPDYTADVAKKRAAFNEAKQLLRSCAGVKFGVLFPAVLRVTSATGQDNRFTDPSTEIDFIKKNLQP
ncbi:unnamed protein product [Knipowitschia caucasica]|uniref:L1 transposable element RRM domain-containing protein n=1 Tax=Knipowitschia caucasica TaxID=637954 RepID=A0AAV2LEW5_KNICA